jgi:hypothetical protein
MKNYRNLLFLFLLAACTSDPKPQTADVFPAQENKPDTNTAEDPDELYMRIGNPDTALAMFLYKNYKDFDPQSQIIEYMRWDLEHEKIKPLLVSLYIKGNDKDSVLITLEKNRKDFYDTAVTTVMEEYKRLHGVSGQWFTYLLEKNDEVVVPLLRDLLRNPKAPDSEKEYAQQVLKNYKIAEK